MFWIGAREDAFRTRGVSRASANLSREREMFQGGKKTKRHGIWVSFLLLCRRDRTRQLEVLLPCIPAEHSVRVSLHSKDLNLIGEIDDPSWDDSIKAAVAADRTHQMNSSNTCLRSR